MSALYDGLYRITQVIYTIHTSIIKLGAVMTHPQSMLLANWSTQSVIYNVAFYHPYIYGPKADFFRAYISYKA